MISSRKIWEIVNVDRVGDRASKLFDFFIIVLIVLNTLAVVLQTIATLDKQYGKVFYVFEIFSISVFTIEYLLRLILCTHDYKYKHPVTGRMKFVLRPQIIVDLLAILPFYLPFFNYDLRFIRIIRVFRIIRIFKLERYISALSMIRKVFKKKKEELVVFLAIFTVMLLLASVIVYDVEHAAQPKVFADSFKALWWAITSMTHISSDIYPVTALGKVFASITSILGLIMTALLTSIIASGFFEVVKEKAGEKRKQNNV